MSEGELVHFDDGRWSGGLKTTTNLAAVTCPDCRRAAARPADPDHDGEA